MLTPTSRFAANPETPSTAISILIYLRDGFVKLSLQACAFVAYCPEPIVKLFLLGCAATVAALNAEIAKYYCNNDCDEFLANLLSDDGTTDLMAIDNGIISGFVHSYAALEGYNIAKEYVGRQKTLLSKMLASGLVLSLTITPSIPVALTYQNDGGDIRMYLGAAAASIPFSLYGSAQILANLLPYLYRKTERLLQDIYAKCWHRGIPSIETLKRTEYNYVVSIAERNLDYIVRYIIRKKNDAAAVRNLDAFLFDPSYPINSPYFIKQFCKMLAMFITGSTALGVGIAASIAITNYIPAILMTTIFYGDDEFDLYDFDTYWQYIYPLLCSTTIVYANAKLISENVYAFLMNVLWSGLLRQEPINSRQYQAHPYTTLLAHASFILPALASYAFIYYSVLLFDNDLYPTDEDQAEALKIVWLAVALRNYCGMLNLYAKVAEKFSDKIELVAKLEKMVENLKRISIKDFISLVNHNSEFRRVTGTLGSEPNANNNADEDDNADEELRIQNTSWLTLFCCRKPTSKASVLLRDMRPTPA